MGAEPVPSSSPWRGPLAAAAFVAAVHVGWGAFSDAGWAPAGLADPDSYMRLVRVGRLLETGAWFDSVLPRANWPHGASLHWTRLMDIVLVALMAPLVPVLGAAKALYWAGVIAGPLLHALTAAALAWGAAPLIGRAGAAVAGALTAAQLGVVGYATAGHADHHILFALLAVLAMGAVLRVLMDRDGAGRFARGAGLFLALGLWVGPEAQVMAGLSMLAVALCWAADGEGGDAVIQNLRLTSALALALALVLLVERGIGGFLDVEYDRVAIIHLAPVIAALVFWEGIEATARRGRTLAAGRVRLGVGAVAAAAAFAVTWVLFPGIAGGPLAGVDPVYADIRGHLSELGPVGGGKRFLLYLGTVFAALPWALWRLRRGWPGPAARGWALIALAMAVYAALAMGWLRWSLYAGLFMAVALADLLMSVDAALDRRDAGARRLALKAGAVLALVVGPIVVAAGLGAGAGHREAGAQASCPLAAAAAGLNAPPLGDRPMTVLASANWGPEILYRTRHRVLTTLHHRSLKGFFDAARIMGGVDDGAARDLIDKRRVDLVLICPGAVNDRYLAGPGGGTLYRRLQRGDGPPWLAEVDLGGRAGDFRLFEVRTGG